MRSPPSYPRVAHVPPAPAATRDDLVLDEGSLRALLAQPVVVEEKLDGANVMLWVEDDVVHAATRGGPGARDRSGQLGPLRAWVAERAPSLRGLLTNGWILYGEWMWLRHSVRYDALPELLIGLDLCSPDTGFASLVERDRTLARAGLVPPPRLFDGVLRTRRRLDELLATSRYGDDRAEGLIVRPVDATRAGVRLAKVVAPAFVGRTDESWRGQRERNAVVR